MFDPAQVTTIFSLAAAAMWAIVSVKTSRKIVVVSTALVTLAAMGTAAGLEFHGHVDACDDSPRLVLNEVCAAGDRCSGGKDFVEVRNLSSLPVKLECFALTNLREARRGSRVNSNFVLLKGEIPPGGVWAWDEDDLGFRLSWSKSDRVVLHKVELRPGKPLAFSALEQVQVTETQTYLARTGLGWSSMSHAELSKTVTPIGTFGKHNSP
jgi:hypothetical protein